MPGKDPSNTPVEDLTEELAKEEQDEIRRKLEEE